ncbi:MAG: MFS transporter [Dehalococcoidia bacterium]|nr:MFS transporter [Dehalococcoidia bacterium]NUQ54714.1 MFS transporter [Dehalococcoidia bacterium]
MSVRQFVRNGPLWRVIAAEGVSVAGDWVLITAASIHVFRETSSTFAVSALLALAAAPTILLAPLGGTMADRHDRARLMVLSDAIIAAVLLAGTALAGGMLSLAIAYAAVLAAAASAAFHRPASEALLPSLTAPGELGRANSVLRLASRIAMIGGPALAGFLMSGNGFAVVMAFDAGTFLISAGLMVTLIGRRAPSPVEAHESALRAALAGWDYTRRRREIAVVTAAIAVTMVMGAIISAGTLAFVSEELDLPESRYGALLAVEGAGAVALAVAFILIGPRLNLLLTGTAALVATGAACASLGLAPSLAWAMGIMAVMGMGEVGLQVAFSSYLQQQSDDAFRGRVMSLVGMMAALGRLAGLAMAGPAVDFAGAPAAFAVAGLVIMVSALPVAGLAVSSGRRMPARA